MEIGNRQSLQVRYHHLFYAVAVVGVDAQEINSSRKAIDVDLETVDEHVGENGAVIDLPEAVEELHVHVALDAELGVDVDVIDGGIGVEIEIDCVADAVVPIREAIVAGETIVAVRVAVAGADGVPVRVAIRAVLDLGAVDALRG